MIIEADTAAQACHARVDMGTGTIAARASLLFDNVECGGMCEKFPMRSINQRGGKSSDHAYINKHGVRMG